jgi:hypothetical protein
MGRLVLCSYGLRAGQITPETLAALRECDAIYGPPPPKYVRSALAGPRPAFEDGRGRSEPELIKEIVARVKRGQNVAYLAYGDPLFLNGACETLAALGKKEGLECVVYRGISSLGELLGDLQLAANDAPGVRLCWPTGRDFRFDPQVPLLVFLFGVYPPEGTIARPLLNAVQRAYPPDHKTSLVTVSAGSVGGSRKTFRVRDLVAACREAGHHSTLYIPAVGAGKRSAPRRSAK